MSSKRPSFIELHCEKLLAVLLGVALAGITVWQLVFLSVGVKVGTETLSIQDIRGRIERQEQALSKKLDRDAPVPLELPEAKQISSAEVFEHQRIAAVAPASSLAPNQPAFGKMLMAEAGSQRQWFHVPEFAAARMEGAVVTRDAIDATAIPPEFRETNAAFATAHLPPESTDVTWVTPWAVIDLAGMRSELLRDDLGKRPPQSAIPRPWINDALAILDVAFERQQKRADGSWSDPIVVAIAPGQDSWRPAVESSAANASTRDTVFANLSDYDIQLDVLQPALLPMVRGNFAQPTLQGGSSAPALSPQAQQELLARKRLATRSKALKKIEADVTAAGGELEPPPDTARDSGRGGDSGTKDKGGGFGGGMGGGGSVNKRTQDDPDGPGATESKERRIRLTRQVRRARKEFEKLRTDFEKQFPAVAASENASANAPTLKFADVPEVVTWTHDFDVQEGTTYRYRATLKVYNPFFTRKILLVQEQESLAQGIAVRSAVSEWGGEVSIPLGTSFFLTRGSARDGIGGRRIGLELFRHAGGEMRTSSIDLVPGDRVGKDRDAKGGDVQFETPWFLVDIFEDAGGEMTDGVATADRSNLIAVFQRVDATGEMEQELRPVESDKNSSLHKEFRDAALAASLKKPVAAAPGG